MRNLDDFEPNASGTDNTSLTLLERVKAADEGAWQRLVYLYSPLVFSWCRRSGLSSEDSSDVMQEVFAAVAAHIGRFQRHRAGDTFRGWLRVITRNKIRLHFRQTAGQPLASGGTDAHIRIQNLVDGPHDETDPLAADGAGDAHDDAHGDADEVRDLLHWGVELVRNAFEDNTWQAFWMCVVQQRSSVEVAEALSMTSGAVRQAKHKVLHRLRSELGDLLR